MSILRNLSILGVIAFLFGCSTSNPYKKKGGEWEYDGQPIRTADAKSFVALNNRFARDKNSGYYRGSAIENSDGPTFAAVTDHYAKDKRTVYFCDTYRKGQEYYLYKYNRTNEVAGADPASFRCLKDEYGYMRDDKNLFSDGRLFPVHDINTFETLQDGFDRDAVSGYYRQTEIKGSDGRTFKVINDHYSKDANRVYYSDFGAGSPDAGEYASTIVIKSASPGTFELLADVYAKDATGVYYSGQFITSDTSGFEILGSGYAKNSAQVFFYGKPIRTADAHTFVLNIPADDLSDATDKKGKYLDGKLIK